MAAPSESSTEVSLRSPEGTPSKVRDLINEGIVNEDNGTRKEAPVSAEESNDFEASSDANPSETTSKDAFFSRVESFSSLTWAGKPPELSPLVCAGFGWSNISCDMLKCSSCLAYLCASLQPTLDVIKYKERCAELQESLKNAHKKYCFWPDNPCPDHYWTLMVTEPSAVLSEFVERFQNLCHLEMQLPPLNPEDLNNMEIKTDVLGHVALWIGLLSQGLTKDTVSLLLQLIDDEMKPKDARENLSATLPTDSLRVHIAACILALCGWNRSPSSLSQPLSVVYCKQCTRKVGLWSFKQLDTVDTDTSPGTPVTPVSPGEGQSDRTPLGVMNPNRRVTRSQDIEQSPSMVYTRKRSWELSSPAESEAFRSRPVTRSMGQDAPEPGSSPHRKVKRLRLCSSSSSDTSPRVCFDPLYQHRRWCPWVTVYKTGTAQETDTMSTKETERAMECGWKEILQVLLADVKSRSLTEQDSSSVSEKSSKIFRLFRQWQTITSS